MNQRETGKQWNSIQINQRRQFAMVDLEPGVDWWVLFDCVILLNNKHNIDQHGNEYPLLSLASRNNLELALLLNLHLDDLDAVVWWCILCEVMLGRWVWCYVLLFRHQLLIHHEMDKRVTTMKGHFGILWADFLVWLFAKVLREFHLQQWLLLVLQSFEKRWECQRSWLRIEFSLVLRAIFEISSWRCVCQLNFATFLENNNEAVYL